MNMMKRRKRRKILFVAERIQSLPQKQKSLTVKMDSRKNV